MQNNKCNAKQLVYFMPLHVSSTCAHHQEVKITLHRLWYHHTFRCDDTRGCVMQNNKCNAKQLVYFMPLHVSSTYAHHQEVKITLHSLWYHHTFRCDDTRSCVMQNNKCNAKLLVYFMPLHVSSTCAHHQEVIIDSLWYHNKCNAKQ